MKQTNTQTNFRNEHKKPQQCGFLTGIIQTMTGNIYLELQNGIPLIKDNKETKHLQIL
jgi:hypothetical protein